MASARCTVTAALPLLTFALIQDREMQQKEKASSCVVSMHAYMEVTDVAFFSFILHRAP